MDRVGQEATEWGLLWRQASAPAPVKKWEQLVGAMQVGAAQIRLCAHIAFSGLRPLCFLRHHQ